MSDSQRIISRARTLMALGKARSWSHAIGIAADTVTRSDTPHHAAEGDDRDDSSGFVPRILETT